jgi:hypothetical protein
MIVIEIEDAKFDDEDTPKFLKSIGGKSITVIREPIDQ